MRSIWKGAISFGLVSIPVRLYSATQERDVSFHQVRRSDGVRIRYRRVAESDGEEVPYADIAKGYELPDGETVVLTDEDFASLPLTTSRSIDVLEFVPLDQVDPIYFAKSYYLEPDRPGLKPYVLLRDALAGSGRVALVKVALRQREQLATLRVRDEVFVLETMLWPDEVREPDFDFLAEEVDVRSQELAMAGSLIETLAADFDPTKFSDGYREALQAVIDAKIAGREVVAPATGEAAGAPAGDLMAALRASIEAAREGRGDGGAESGAPARARRTQKSPGAKAGTKSPTGGKATAGTAKPAKVTKVTEGTAKTTTGAKTTTSAKATVGTGRRTRDTAQEDTDRGPTRRSA
ncbi:DNA end-binding protein Ku [Parafrankia irregularis]|uniref:Non-homologous end joining protein Ku n=1 Tax=Parafrankia irregularis TaxID=795642 RepID=A0A0S4QU88_9ACTN|nr:MULTISPECIES: Ku protein [Parafrankia]MBE3205177.1 Ku protein [Parafrankia sp. CH37]CUU58868.1 DNA end-binding protein Ku [Parafrankia irregularis]